MSFFKTRFLLISLLIFSLLGLCACNLFNPASSGDVPNEKDALFQEAYRAYRKTQYADALENFDRAIKKDSTLSEAYLGAVKSLMGIYNINLFAMIGEVRKAEKSEIPFMDLSGTELENYHLMVSKALPYIRELIRRDTTKAPKNNPHKYSDKQLTFSQIASGYSIFEMAEMLLKFRKTTAIFNLNIFKDESTGSFSVDMNTLYSMALENPENASIVNEAILELKNDIGNFSHVILPSVKGHSDLEAFGDESLVYAVSEEIESTADDIQGQVSFFMINDNLDNDGDGCIDEEIFDNQDNDGDGLIDEDLRLVPLTRLSEDKENPEFDVVIFISPDNKDHDMDGISDGKSELTYKVEAKNRIESKNFKLLFASGASFSNSKSLDLKQEVANDTQKDNLKFNLKSRQKKIGGCWVNYTEESFNALFEGGNE